MPKLVEIQRFIIWVCGSIMVFGLIATLIAYLLYDNQTPADCQGDDCQPQTNTVVVSANDNKILKIVAPTLIAVGLIIIVCVRCWQQNTRRSVAVSETATNNGEENGGYQGPEFDFDAPPSYTEALHMEVISESHGSFPVEPPPKYDVALAQIEEISNSLESRSDFTIHRGSARHEVMEDNVAAVQGRDNDESSGTSSVSEDAVSIDDSQTVQSTVISDHSNHDEQRTISTADNRSVDEHEIRETRILVHQRDSCLSSDDIQEFPERDSEQFSSRNTTNHSSLSNEEPSHYRDDGTLEVEIDDLPTDMVVHQGPDILNNENQGSETDVNSQSTAGRNAEQNSCTATVEGNVLSSSYATITSVALSECPSSDAGPVSLEDPVASDYCHVTINSTNNEPSSVSVNVANEGEQNANESTQHEGLFYV